LGRRLVDQFVDGKGGSCRFVSHRPVEGFFQLVPIDFKALPICGCSAFPDSRKVEDADQGAEDNQDPEHEQRMLEQSLGNLRVACERALEPEISEV
jgi:hypothetical protein